MGEETTLKIAAAVTASAGRLTATVTAFLCTTNPWIVVAAIAGMTIVGVAVNSGKTQKN